MADSDKLIDDPKVDKRKVKDIQIDGGALKSAYRQSQKLPQAVLKISSYSSGVGRVQAHLKYISRNGDLHVEDPQGNFIDEPEKIRQRIDEWSMDFDTRKNSRDTMNMVLSAPEGSELGAVENSVREFARKTFGESHDYLFAIHNDTDHPHGHLVVKMRGYEGEKLNPGKKELKLWRSEFAAALRENGIMVDSSSRSERGVGRKGTRQDIIHIRQRTTPHVDKEAVKRVIKETHEGVNQSNKPWAKAAKQNTAQHAQTMMHLADKAKEVSTATGNANLSKMADQISKHASSIPTPKTRDEEYQKQMIDQKTHQADLER